MVMTSAKHRNVKTTQQEASRSLSSSISKGTLMKLYGLKPALAVIVDRDERRHMARSQRPTRTRCAT